MFIDIINPLPKNKIHLGCSLLSKTRFRVGVVTSTCNSPKYNMSINLQLLKKTQEKNVPTYLTSTRLQPKKRKPQVPVHAIYEMLVLQATQHPMRQPVS